MHARTRHACLVEMKFLCFCDVKESCCRQGFFLYLTFFFPSFSVPLIALSGAKCFFFFILSSFESVKIAFAYSHFICSKNLFLLCIKQK